LRYYILGSKYQNVVFQATLVFHGVKQYNPESYF